jgi:hypothetical protein
MGLPEVGSWRMLRHLPATLGGAPPGRSPQLGEQRDANHGHSVWRDPTNDFGLDILAAHRAGHH